MRILTETVYPDEPCYGLYEGPRTRRDRVGRDTERWIQQVFVIRGDAIACWERDYGRAAAFGRVSSLIMPSFGENSVAQLQHFAEKNRHDDYWARRGDELAAESTLIQDHVRQFEVDREVIANRSVFGPSVTVQRDGYSRTAARRKLMDKVDRYYGTGQWNRSKAR